MRSSCNLKVLNYVDLLSITTEFVDSWAVEGTFCNLMRDSTLWFLFTIEGRMKAEQDGLCCELSTMESIAGC